MGAYAMIAGKAVGAAGTIMASQAQAREYVSGYRP